MYVCIYAYLVQFTAGFLNLQTTVVSTGIISFNANKLRILPAEYICLLDVALIISDNYFIELH
jgi:hypothetical protein